MTNFSLGWDVILTLLTHSPRKEKEDAHCKTGADWADSLYGKSAKGKDTHKLIPGPGPRNRRR